MTIDLRTCVPGQKLRMRNGKFAVYNGTSLSDAYPHCVDYDNDLGTRTDNGRTSISGETQQDIIEIIPMNTQSTIPQRSTKDFTKYAISVMMAHDRGEVIEVASIEKDKYWWKATAPNWDWRQFVFRIKPKPAVVPWTIETCPVGKVVRKDGMRYVITKADETHAFINNYGELDYVVFLEGFTMDDGSPCGTVQP